MANLCFYIVYLEICRFVEHNFALIDYLESIFYRILVNSKIRLISRFNHVNIKLGLKGLAQAKIIKKSVILFRVLNMTI